MRILIRGDLYFCGLTRGDYNLWKYLLVGILLYIVNMLCLYKKHIVSLILNESLGSWPFDLFCAFSLPFQKKKKNLFLYQFHTTTGVSTVDLDTPLESSQ